VGAYSGLYALINSYIMDITARSPSGGESHLQRTTQTVAIPVFQFGMFSSVDLSFFSGTDFNFGGRVATNGNLFLAEGAGVTLTLSDKVTAVGAIVRQTLQNGVAIAVSGHTGTVKIPTASGACTPNTNVACRALAAAEGSVVNGPSALEDPTLGGAEFTGLTPTWSTISLSTYNAYIRNGLTGATTLNLPVIVDGGANIDLVQRPVPNENTTNPLVYGERFFTKASLRILLSDTAADITGLPSITATAPVSLEPAAWPPVGYTAGTPIATSLGALPVAATTTAATASGAATITVNAMPAWFAKPQLTVKNGATFEVGPFTCTTWTDTTFQGCNESTKNLTAGWTIYVSNPAGTATAGAGNMPGNPIPAVTLASPVSKGAAITLPLTAGQSTWAFAANTFWLTDVAAGGTGLSTQVTCTGATGLQFTGCTGVPATKSGATVTTGYLSTQGTGTIGGYLKVEMQLANNTWQDVTMELLNDGIGGPNLGVGVAACGDPTPNAILRIERLRDNASAAPNTTCPSANSLNAYDYWPNALFDTREGLQRDCGPVAGNCNAPGSLVLGGVMYYVTIDVANLSKWFTCTLGNGLPCSGVNAISNSGYTVYFSDRRNNCSGAVNCAETGEYGFEDFVNPLSATGVPNGVLDAGEDLNANGVLDVYGKVPSYNGVPNTAPPGAALPLNATAGPITALTAAQAQVNRALLFRRALKLINGGLGKIVMPGLTVVAENPVYIQGDWNMNVSPPVAGDGHAETSVIADAVTLLSSSWTDDASFSSPYDPTAGGRARTAANDWFRVAIIAGKGLAFPNPAGTTADFGTDGGVHNFLRFLESGGTVNYVGSIATFYYNQQAVGTYKYSASPTVYNAPTRNYVFDTDFLEPTTLPPLTPVFRDVNTIGFYVEVRPGR